jgi:hypothetical protein
LSSFFQDFCHAFPWGDWAKAVRSSPASGGSASEVGRALALPSHSCHQERDFTAEGTALCQKSTQCLPENVRVETAARPNLNRLDAVVKALEPAPSRRHDGSAS